MSYRPSVDCMEYSTNPDIKPKQSEILHGSRVQLESSSARLCLDRCLLPRVFGFWNTRQRPKLEPTIRCGRLGRHTMKYESGDLEQRRGISVAARILRATAWGTVSAAILTTLAACQVGSQRIVSHENNLAAAGFELRPADTPKRRALLAQLPAHKFIRRVNQDTVRYVYADPSVCRCLYVGTQQAYGQYQKNKQSDARIRQLERALKDHQNAAEDDDFNEQVYDNPAFDWEAWGPWG